MLRWYDDETRTHGFMFWQFKFSYRNHETYEVRVSLNLHIIWDEYINMTL